jgi:hypothetical protein
LTLFFAALATLGAALPAAEPAGVGGADLPPPGLAPLAGKPEGWRTGLLSGAVRPAPGGLHLPRAAIGREPVAADAAKLRPLRARPSVDIPQVAEETALRLPAPRLRPATPLAYSPSPDPARLAFPGASTLADPDRPTATSDTAQEDGRRAVLWVRPDVSQKAASFLRVALPDPEELAAPVRLEKAPADDDPPAYSLELPPQPMMPTLPQAKK